MIYTARRRLLSPTLSGYMRASTENPNGWRPQYTRLSGPGLPDWKTVVAIREEQSRQRQQGIAALQQSEMRKLAYYDSVTRGAAPRTLGELSGVDPMTMAVLAGIGGLVYLISQSPLGGVIGSVASSAGAGITEATTAFNNAAGTNILGTGPKASPQTEIASGTPLTAAQADGIAKSLGNPGAGWQLSPDHTQIWFFDGSYYDNTSGHYYVVIHGQTIDQGTIAV